MSASGIGISPELSRAFAAAAESSTVRFLKIAIQNESLMPDSEGPIDATGSALEDDLEKLQSMLEDNVPAYVLARLGGESSDWLAISYVPETAKIRDKMLYASTRNALVKGLGAQVSDSLFATSKADLTPAAYAAHKAHMAAPVPLTAREREQAEAREAERQAGGATFERKRNHVGTGVGLIWTGAAEAAVKELGQGESDQLLVLSINTASESLEVSLAEERTVSEIAARLPPSSPSYALFAWTHSHTSTPRRDIVFIYTCPSSSPIKERMIYSSGASSVQQTAKALLADSGSPSTFASRKIETSDPSEISEDYLVAELGLKHDDVVEVANGGGKLGNVSGEGRAFARPKGPGRKW